MTLPVTLAHRGYSARAPENTHAAFELAVSEGCPALELDVHVCATGEAVIIHDYTLARTGGREGRVEDLSWDELRRVDVGSWFDGRFGDQRIPLLEELIANLDGQVFYDIEIKWPPRGRGVLEAEIARIVAASELYDRCFVSSFNPLSIRRVEQIDPRIGTALIYSHHVPAPLRRGQGRLFSKCRILKPHHAMVDEGYMRRLGRRKGYAIAPWTVDDGDEARRLRDLGAASVITNDPSAVTRGC